MHSSATIKVTLDGIEPPLSDLESEVLRYTMSPTTTNNALWELDQ